MVGAAAANSTWRKAWVALGLALLSLAPYLAGIWFLYEYEPGQHIDYGVAVLSFGIGVHEVMEGLKDRSEKGQTRRVALDGFSAPTQPTSARSRPTSAITTSP